MTIDLQTSIRFPPDITVDGRGQNVQILSRGFQIMNSSRNIIITHLSMDGMNKYHDEEDAVSIANRAHTVWLNHLALQRYGDGLVDITNGATDVTVSWVKFFNHDKVMAINSYDETGNLFAEYDRDSKAKVTIHHSLFLGTTQRHPRLVFGQAHIYNNVFYNWSYYGISVGLEAQALIEGNYFIQLNNASAGQRSLVNGDWDKGYYDNTNGTYHYTRTYLGYVAVLSNEVEGSAWQPSNYLPEKVFIPSYAYDFEIPSPEMQTKVFAQAGNVNAIYAPAGFRRFPFWNLSMGSYGAAFTAGSGFRDFGFTELSGLSSHQVDFFGERMESTVPFEVSFSFKPNSNTRALTFYVLDRSNQANYVAVTLDPGAANLLASAWQGGSGAFLAKEASLDPVTGEVRVRIKSTIANSGKSLRFNFRAQQIVVNGASRSYVDSFAGNTSSQISFTNFSFNTFSDTSDSIIGDMLGTWRNIDALAMQITEQPLPVLAPAITSPQISVLGGRFVTSGSATDLSFYETTENSSHQASMYFDRAGSGASFQLSFLATLDLRRVFTFYVLKADDQSGHQLSFTYNPVTKTFSSKSSAGSGKIISADAVQDPVTKKFQFNIVGELTTLPSKKIRLNFRSQKPGIDSFVGDATVLVGIQNLLYQEMLPGPAGSPGVTVLKETNIAGEREHAMQAYFYGYAKRLWTLDFEFKPMGNRHVSLFFANALNQGSNFRVRCTTSGAQIIAPSNPALKNLTAQMTVQSDGWYRCTVRGVPDSLGGNQLRLIWYLNNNSTQTSSYQGDGVSGVMMRNIVVTDK